MLLSYYVTHFSLSGLQRSERELDIAIFGKGYLCVTDQNNGDTYYTRHGRLKLNAQGQLVCGLAPGEAWLIEPNITLPMEASAVTIRDDGSVQFEIPGSSTSISAGQIQLANFINPEGLREIEILPGILQATDDSGAALVGNPGINGLGYTRNHWIELPKSESIFQISALWPLGVVILLVLMIAEMRSLRSHVELLLNQVEKQSSNSDNSRRSAMSIRDEVFRAIR